MIIQHHNNDDIYYLCVCDQYTVSLNYTSIDYKQKKNTGCQIIPFSNHDFFSCLYLESNRFFVIFQFFLLLLLLIIIIIAI